MRAFLSTTELGTRLAMLAAMSKIPSPGRVVCPACKTPLRAQEVMEDLMQAVSVHTGSQFPLSCQHCKASYQVPRREVERLVIETKTQHLFQDLAHLLVGMSNKH